MALAIATRIARRALFILTAPEAATATAIRQAGRATATAFSSTIQTVEEGR